MTTEPKLAAGEELNPCPWCGKVPYISWLEADLSATIECQGYHDRTCPATYATVIRRAKTREEAESAASKAWNTRAKEPTP